MREAIENLRSNMRAFHNTMAAINAGGPTRADETMALSTDATSSDQALPEETRDWRTPRS